MLQLVIPAYNEEHRLPRTLRELRRHAQRLRPTFGALEVIVVDNASTDATAAVARAADRTAMPVRLVPCPTRGKGAAVRAGLAATDAEIVGFMDADGATRLDALEEAWRRLSLGADVAIGSRSVAGARTASRHSWLRDRGARCYRSCTARIVPGVGDTQCGFKLMSGDLARAVCRDLRSTGFCFDVELLARARLRGARIDEFPVVWSDVPGSTFHPARHGASSFLGLGRIAWDLRAERAAVGSAPTRVPVLAPVPAGAAVEAWDGGLG